MKTLLLTGFEPFLDFSVNPTQEIAKALDGETIGNYRICGRLLPVSFVETADGLFSHYEETQPDDVMLLGLAAGRQRITPERVAINCNDGAADNEGVVHEDQPIVKNGPDAYFSKLPIRRFVNALTESGYPANISNTAGTYLCNNVMYNMIHKISTDGNRGVRAGFVHLPASHRLALHHKNMPSWSQHDLLEAVKRMIQVLDG